MVYGNSLWQLIQQTDMITKIVLILLVVLSIVCWTIFFYKLIMLRFKKQQMAEAIDDLKQVSSLDMWLTLTSKHAKTAPGRFFSKVLVFLKILFECQPGKRELTDRECVYMENHIDQTVDEMIEHEHSYMPVLSTSAAAAPLIGLFGTVWGLVHSFMRIHALQSADITTVAPGIAEALITTLAGLFVAIPTLAMYSYLSSQIRRHEQLVITLGDRVTFFVQQVCRSQ